MDTHALSVRLNKPGPRWCSVQRPRGMKRLVPIHIDLFSPPNGVAAFKLLPGTSPWLVPGNYGTVQESARGWQLKPCQAVCGQLGSVDGPRGVLKPVPSPGIRRRRSCRAAAPGSWGMGYIQKLSSDPVAGVGGEGRVQDDGKG